MSVNTADANTILNELHLRFIRLVNEVTAKHLERNSRPDDLQEESDRLYAAFERTIDNYMHGLECELEEIRLDDSEADGR